MQKAKWLAIGLCVLFVIGAYAVWNFAFAGFNPNPVSTTLSTIYTCSTASSCGEFRIVSVNISLVGGEAELSNGIQSQSLSLQVDVLGQVAMASVQVFVNNTSIGTESGPFPPGISKVLYFPVPTTISVTPSETYAVSVQGTFSSQVPGGTATSYIASKNIVATD